MGRQIQLSMLADDVRELLDDVRLCGDVEIVMRDGDSAVVQPLVPLPVELHGTAILWRKTLLPRLERKLITSAKPPYWRVDEFANPVLEFSASVLTKWSDRPALTQGRIYGRFDGKPVEFAKWFERIVRRIRKRWRKNPVSLLGGYIGPAASKWFDSGGLLLPMFVPPITSDWIRVMEGQHHPR